MMTIFDKHNSFTETELQSIVNLGSYGRIMCLLISNCIRQGANRTKYSVGFLREQFDCVDKYPLFTDFKRHVLMKAIKDVESHTNLRINIEPIRTEKAITDVSFEFHQLQKAKTY